MAERKINPLWTACNRIVKTTELIDKHINKVCQRYYNHEHDDQFKDLIETLKPQVEDYRAKAYGNVLNYHRYITDEEYDAFAKDIEKVGKALGDHVSFPEEVQYPVLREFYDLSVTMDATLNVCLPE